jgi:hypothetical protein
VGVVTELVATVANRTPAEVNADLARLTRVVRRDFGRNKWPVEVKGPPSRLPDGLRHGLDTAKAWQEVMRNRTP